MSRRLDVLTAIKALVTAAVPGARVIGLDGEDATLAAIPTGGRVVVKSGDPGEPVVDLSPPMWNFTHAVPIEIDAPPFDTTSAEAQVDAIAAAIGAAVRANRTLGGLVDWLDAGPLTTDDITTPGATVARGGDLILTAIYAVADPLN